MYRCIEQFDLLEVSELVERRFYWVQDKKLTFWPASLRALK